MRVIFPCWVSGSSRAKTYGKGATRGAHEERPTLPRRPLFGKDAEERLCLFKDFRTLRSLIEPPFSGKLPSITINSALGQGTCNSSPCGFSREVPPQRARRPTLPSIPLFGCIRERVPRQRAPIPTRRPSFPRAPRRPSARAVPARGDSGIPRRLRHVGERSQHG